jgi:hypothetical protein
MSFIFSDTENDTPASASETKDQPGGRGKIFWVLLMLFTTVVLLFYFLKGCNNHNTLPVTTSDSAEKSMSFIYHNACNQFL